MADNTNEYGNKMLNGDGLLHLVGTIKTEIANAGGTEYLAGDGISIETNQEGDTYVSNTMMNGINFISEHSEGDDYTETSLTPGDNLVVNYFRADGSRVAETFVGSDILLTSYSTDSKTGEEVETAYLNLAPSSIIFSLPEGATGQLEMDTRGDLLWNNEPLGGTVYTAGTGISISRDGVISLDLPSAEEATF